MPLLRRLSPVKIFCNATIHTKNVTYYTKHSSKKKSPHLTLAMPQYELPIAIKPPPQSNDIFLLLENYTCRDLWSHPPPCTYKERKCHLRYSSLAGCFCYHVNLLTPRDHTIGLGPCLIKRRSLVWISFPPPHGAKNSLTKNRNIMSTYLWTDYQLRLTPPRNPKLPFHAPLICSLYKTYRLWIRQPYSSSKLPS